MRYSVFDWSAQKFRVYADQRLYAVNSDGPRCAPVGPSYAGMVDVTSALCPVPADAQFIGWSDVATGQVARLAGGMPGVQTGAPQYGSPNLGGVGGVGGGYFGDGLGIAGTPLPLGQTVSGVPQTRALTLAEGIMASTVISLVSGIISAWFLAHIRVKLT